MAGSPNNVPIPDELVSMVAENRVIPFVGSGFSAALGFPTWNELLRRVSEGMDNELPYEDIYNSANGDPLQIAEYLYIKSFKSIGPIRHVIEQALPTDVDPVKSSPHVELVNLGASQIYTTNYDDLIEDTFKALKVPVNVITLPREVATARSDETQVVKYHGDLRHDETLVLTESSYYKRLDFESPMDLKFRSDLLGRSVLFMGYSFRDINIRVIWFKLVQMMKDIPEEDRRPSYIVRLEPNPVLQELDRAAGLRTIVLSNGVSPSSPEKRTALLSDFLYRLGLAASPQSKSRGEPMYVSGRLIEMVKRDLALHSRMRGPGGAGLALGQIGRAGSFFARRIPESLLDEVRPVYETMLSPGGKNRVDVRAIAYLAPYYGPSPELTFAVARSVGNAYQRTPLLAVPATDWKLLWGAKLTPEHVNTLLEELEEEIEYTLTDEDGGDEDLAYCVDVTKRIVAGELFEGDGAAELLVRAQKLLEEAAEIYPSVRSYTPVPGGAPRPSNILLEVEARRRELASSQHDEDGDEGKQIFEDEDDPF